MYYPSKICCLTTSSMQDRWDDLGTIFNVEFTVKMIL